MSLIGVSNKQTNHISLKRALIKLLILNLRNYLNVISHSAVVGGTADNELHKFTLLGDLLRKIWSKNGLFLWWTVWVSPQVRHRPYDIFSSSWAGDPNLICLSRFNSTNELTDLGLDIIVLACWEICTFFTYTSLHTFLNTSPWNSYTRITSMYFSFFPRLLLVLFLKLQSPNKINTEGPYRICIVGDQFY